MSRRPILLDTHAAIWMALPEALAKSAEAELHEARSLGVAVVVSPITAWEVGLLVARGRMALAVPPRQWFQGLIDAGVELAALTAGTLIESSFLPAGLGGDPADRILVATARELGYRLMTRDRALLRYAEMGHLSAIPC